MRSGTAPAAYYLKFACLNCIAIGHQFLSRLPLSLDSRPCFTMLIVAPLRATIATELKGGLASRRAAS
jgi:hypothetical protein